MPTRAKQQVVSDIPDKQQRAWNELVHEIANDLAALKLLLAAVDLADDDEERSRHLGAAKQTIVEGESRLQALRDAVRRQLGESSTAPRNGASKPPSGKTNESRKRRAATS